MGGCCEGDCCVGYSSRPAIGSTSVAADNKAHAAKIANELAGMKQKLTKYWNEREKDLFHYITDRFDNILQQLREQNQNQLGGVPLNLDMDGLGDRLNELDCQVIGYVSGSLNERLVQTDKELGAILEERDDKKRGKNFEAFCDRVEKQAVEELKERIRAITTKRENVIREEISSRLNEIDQSIKRQTEAYEALIQARKRDVKKFQRLQMDSIYTCALCETFLSEIGE